MPGSLPAGVMREICPAWSHTSLREPDVPDSGSTTRALSSTVTSSPIRAARLTLDGRGRSVTSKVMVMSVAPFAYVHRVGFVQQFPECLSGEAYVSRVNIEMGDGTNRGRAKSAHSYPALLKQAVHQHCCGGVELDQV